MTTPPASPSSPAQPMHVPAFFVHQKVTMMVNRYEILEARPDGTEGALLAFAQQRRLAFKEQVTFYADRDENRALFSFQARKVMDLGSGYDVLDGSGQPIGFFRKQFGKSLLRSSWEVSGRGLEALGTERRQSVAVLRRVWDFLPVVGDVPVPFVFHFDFRDAATGELVMTDERKVSVRDRYTVTVPDRRLDFRVAASLAVALDALQSR
ncbi:hypothetical protein [Georgenia sp. SYP-B2076]|uniref:hypothetical protein n=1 Tax=Georgenia sp. SYP-B2076 TaxID=2495881 RepID=UPI00197A9986|nr:hypothetical protein [Georgenia sp. SYP-B2076]